MDITALKKQVLHCHTKQDLIIEQKSCQLVEENLKIPWEELEEDRWRVFIRFYGNES